MKNAAEKFILIVLKHQNINILFQQKIVHLFLMCVLLLYLIDLKDTQIKFIKDMFYQGQKKNSQN